MTNYCKHQANPSTQCSVHASVHMAATGISFLCLLHCLALPVLAVALPVAGALGEAEWVHQSLVLLALPFSIYTIVRVSEHKIDWLFGAFFVTGFTLLILSAFVEPFHDYEKLMTTLGAMTVACGHLWRLFSQS